MYFFNLHLECSLFFVNFSELVLCYHDDYFNEFIDMEHIVLCTNCRCWFVLCVLLAEL